MEPNWHRISTTLLDRDDREGTLSVFFEYNLGHWTIGPRIEIDHSWFDLSLDFGPLELSFVYWRRRLNADQ